MVVIGTNDGHDFGSCKQAAETKPSPDLELHILDGVYHAFDEPTFRAVARCRRPADAVQRRRRRDREKAGA